MGWDKLPPDADAVHSNDSTVCTSTPCTTVEHAAFVAWAVLLSHSRTRIPMGAAPLPAHTRETSGSRRCACCTSRHGGGRSIRQQAAACKAYREAHAHEAARDVLGHECSRCKRASVAQSSLRLVQVPHENHVILVIALLPCTGGGSASRTPASACMYGAGSCLATRGPRRKHSLRRSQQLSDAHCSPTHLPKPPSRNRP